MIIKEWIPSGDGWSGAIKYKALDPVQTIKTQRMFHKIHTRQNSEPLENTYDFLEEFIPFIQPLIQEVDLTDKEGKKYGMSDLLQDGSLIAIWMAFCSEITLSLFKKKTDKKTSGKK